MPTQKRFGAFFRAKRTALGLPLREFCRRNGFDPGNISRLERGLLTPPRSAEILDSYAEALKLDSQDRPTLYDLAAAETGAFPKETAKNSAVREALPKVLRTLRERSRRIEPLTNRLDFETWAQSIEARYQFPRLIRRLIHATSADVERIEFPAAEGGEKRGWDGFVGASKGNNFLPSEISVWELGVGSDPAKKAEGDFQKRTKNPLGVDPSEATFVFVTPRSWEGKDKWAAEKKKLAKWQDVRVYDADSLEEWIELAPAVDTWFATLLGKKTEGMLDVDEYWKNLSVLTEPQLTPEVFLTSREKEIQVLEDWLGVEKPKAKEETENEKAPSTKAPSALAIEARSPAEAIDFLSAYIANLSDERRDALSSRIIIVEDRASWSILADELHPLILAPKPTLQLEGEAISGAVRKGHRVLLSSDRFTTGSVETVLLSRANVYSLDEALVKAGFEAARANTAAFDSGGSLTVLKRRLSRFPETTEPAWSRGDVAASLAPLTLIGSWHGGNGPDQRVLAGVAGRDYSEIVDVLTQVATLSDPPVFSIRGTWSLTSREDSWVLLARYLRTDQFERWEKHAVEVLSADDPTFDRPETERHFVRLTDECPTYSAQLRTGIAETLAILGAPLKKLEPKPEGEAFRVSRIVERVLGDTPGWKRWASLGRQLPLLAEASPEAFLSAIEDELHRKDSDILELFADSEDAVVSSCLHAGLLWALETIAWSPAHLLRVGLVLSELADRDTGKRWSNRPKNSLGEIFLPWLPHTGAGVEERIKVLRKITEKKPDAGWNLLLALLPSWHSTSTPTHRPKWRDWALNWREGVTNADHWRQVHACSERLLEMVEDDPSRFSDLVRHMGDLPPEYRKDLIKKLGALDPARLTSNDRIALTKELRDAIRLHKAHPDAKWALPDAEVAGLETVLKHVEPEDPIAKNLWLFAGHVELPEPRDDDWRKTEEKVSTLRCEVISEIYAKGGLEQLLQLAASVQNSWSIGFEMVRTGVLHDFHLVLPELLESEVPQLVEFARGYARGSFEKEKWKWIESLPLKSWKVSQLAGLAFALPAGKRTWDLLDGTSDEASRLYWTTINGLYGISDPAEIKHAVETLLHYERPFLAMQVLEGAVYAKVEVPTELLLGALEMAAFNAVAEKPAGNIRHTVQHLIQVLQTRSSEIEESRLARLEFAFIDVLDGHPVTAVTLHQILGKKPEFFADLLQFLFRSRKEPKDQTEGAIPEHEKSRAQNAYRLLHSWETVPGTDPDMKKIDGDVLRAWVEKARELCRESGHLEICDIHIGEVLAHAPGEEDGSWPCIPVSDLIEDIESSELSRGFIVGTLNKRGVTMRMPFDGGNLERTEAERYAKYAKACEMEWPKTAGALRSIAASYENHAKREDDEAEVHRLGR